MRTLVARRPTAHPLLTSLVCTRDTYASLHIALSPSLSFVPHRCIIKLFTLVFIWIARSSPLALGENARCIRRPPFAMNKKIISRSTEPTFSPHCIHVASYLLFRADRLPKWLDNRYFSTQNYCLHFSIYVNWGTIKLSVYKKFICADDALCVSMIYKYNECRNRYSSIRLCDRNKC